MGFRASGLGVSLPIYVTRETAHGETAEYSLSLWMTLLAGLLVWLNVVLWGGYGIYLFATTI